MLCCSGEQTEVNKTGSKRMERDFRPGPGDSSMPCVGLEGSQSLEMEPIVEPTTGRPESGCSSVGLYLDCGEPSTLGTHFENH